ncbi:MAG: AAA family ATPase [Limisphaerales bacterium]
MSTLHPIANCDRAGRRADVLFLHGLGGHAFKTWRHGEGDDTSWPHWLGQDAPEAGVWSLGYAASPTRLTGLLRMVGLGNRDSGHGMALPDRAVKVLDLMTQRGFGQRPPMFIGHSLGGLLAKQVLRAAEASPDAAKQAVYRQTRAVLFVGTPHAGADLASLAAAFQAIFGTTVSLEDLRAHDPHLRELLNWFRNHAGPAAVHVRTYYELRTLKGFTIVNPTSSHPGVGEDPVGLDEDHLSLAKPRERDSQVCGAALQMLRGFMLAPRMPAVAPGGPHAPAPAVPFAPEIVVRLEPAHFQRDEVRLPRQLPPRATAEEFFGRATELAQLTDRLRRGLSTVVVGPAGMGKTALAAEAVRAVVGDDEKSLAASPFPDGVVLLDLYQLKARSDDVFGALAGAFLGPAGAQENPRKRASEAVAGKQALIIFEGAEEADGRDGRAALADLLAVLAPDNRRLVLTRERTQANPAEMVELTEALAPEDAAALFDRLAGGRVPAAVRGQVLALLQGHPLAITWAGGLLRRDDEDPAVLATEWAAKPLAALNDPDPAKREHKLAWLYGRSVRGLGPDERAVLEAAGLLAHAPFPLAAMDAALGDPGGAGSASPARAARRRLVQAGLLRRVPAEADHWQFTHVLACQFARRETGSDAARRGRLGRWLHGDLLQALRTNEGGEKALSLSRPLLHAAALLRTDDDQRLWDPLANFALYAAVERLTALGRLDMVRLALEAVGMWLDRLPGDKLVEPAWLRERSVLFNRRGDVQLAQGNLAGAQASYEESRKVRARLAAADPTNAQWQRDLFYSHAKLAEVTEKGGEATRALRLWELALPITERLAALDPTNATWQQDVRVSRAQVARLRAAVP